MFISQSVVRRSAPSEPDLNALKRWLSTDQIYSRPSARTLTTLHLEDSEKTQAFKPIMCMVSISP